MRRQGLVSIVVPVYNAADYLEATVKTVQQQTFSDWELLLVDDHSTDEFGDEAARGTGKIVSVPETLTYRRALSRTVIFTSTVLFDRNRIGDGLLAMPDIKSEDTATWWRILRAGYTAFGLNESLAIYRRPKQSLSSNKAAAVARIWNLYRRQEGLNPLQSAWHLAFWAVRATLRRL